MSNELATVTKVRGYLPTMLKALPSDDATRARFERAALAVAQIPYLQNCDAMSLVKCVYECARLNLIPDPVLQLVAIIPFKGKATLIPMYKGLIELARRAEPKLYIHTEHLYEHDEYTLVEGTDTVLSVTRRWWQKGLDAPGKFVASYCISAMPGQQKRTVIVSAQEGLVLAKKSKSGYRQGSVWFDHFESMCDKTAVRKSAKLWSLSPTERDTHRLAEAISLDEADNEDLPEPAMEADTIEGEVVQREMRPAEGEQSVGALKSQAEKQEPRKRAAAPAASKQPVGMSIEQARAELDAAIRACCEKVGVTASAAAFESFGLWWTKAPSREELLKRLAAMPLPEVLQFRNGCQQLTEDQIKKGVLKMDAELETPVQQDPPPSKPAEPVTQHSPQHWQLVDFWETKRLIPKKKAEKALNHYISETMDGKEWTDLTLAEARKVWNAVRDFDFKHEEWEV